MDTLTLFSKNLNQRSLTPRWPLTPCLLRSHVWLYPRIIVSKSHDDTCLVLGEWKNQEETQSTLLFFFHSPIAIGWPFISSFAPFGFPHQCFLCTAHLYDIYGENKLKLKLKTETETSMYVDTVINFANYHIHTYTYYVHTTYILHTTYYVQNEWSHSLLLNSVQARQLLNSVQARQKGTSVTLLVLLGNSLSYSVCSEPTQINEDNVDWPNWVF